MVNTRDEYNVNLVRKVKVYIHDKEGPYSEVTIFNLPHQLACLSLKSGDTFVIQVTGKIDKDEV